jgi:hypothetical protein
VLADRSNDRLRRIWRRGVADRHVGALFPKPLRNCGANAPAAAGNKRKFSLQPFLWLCHLISSFLDYGLMWELADWSKNIERLNLP